MKLLYFKMIKQMNIYLIKHVHIYLMKHVHIYLMKWTGPMSTLYHSLSCAMGQPPPGMENLTL